MPLDYSSDPSRARQAIIEAVEGEDPDAFRIVMGHHPTYAEQVGDLPVDLCLAGHTHGGQIRVPLYGPLFINCSAPKKWSQGTHRVGDTVLDVSAGIGCTHGDALPSIRFRCPPEMTVIDLVPAGKHDPNDTAGSIGHGP